MKIIDSHQHFWRFDPVRDSWITDDMSVIRKDFLPEDLAPVLQENGVDGCVAVQADQSEEQNAFLLELAAVNPFIKGVVGWIDLQSDSVRESLEFYTQYDKMKGFRHVLQGEVDRALMLKPGFKRGITQLEGFGYTYDILIYADQLKYTEEFVKAYPHQRFVIDHIAKPNIKERQLDDWKRDIKAVARHYNVCCKVSGMITEADWNNWKDEDFKPYLDVIFEAFGANRVMFGSDWPVCLVAGGYSKMIEMVKRYTSAMTQNEQQMFWGQNAISFYNLKD